MIRCNRCKTPHTPRTREALAAALANALEIAERQAEDAIRAQCLTTHLRMLRSELEGACSSCAFTSFMDRRPPGGWLRAVPTESK